MLVLSSESYDLNWDSTTSNAPPGICGSTILLCPGEMTMYVRVAVLLSVAVFPYLATAAEWKNELKANIEATFKLCKLDLGGMSPNFNTVSKLGTPLHIRAVGVDGDIASNASVPVTIVEDGH